MAQALESAAARCAGSSMMGCRVPAVSLVVITRNHERYIDEALDSVSRQTLKDFEVIVIDDCSSDGTVGRIRAWLDRTSLDARLIANDQNLGICASRNRAQRLCRGEFVAGLSGDDYYEPHKLERQYVFFKTLDRSVAAVFGKARIVNEAGEELGVWFEHSPDVPEGQIFDRLIRGNFLPAPTVMVRRSTIDEVGGYDESLFYEDYDMWLRIADRYEFRYLPDILVNYRWHDRSTSQSPANRGRLNESRVRLLLRWYGRSSSTNGIVIAHAWKAALMVFAADRCLGQRALRRVYDARPSSWRRVTMLAALLPGAHAVAARTFALLKHRHSRRKFSRGDNRLIVP
jgi:glycosyltransferase involved in cell wall biosynthesis